MKPAIWTVVMGGAIAFATPLACAAGESSGAREIFAPYSEDYTQGKPITAEKLKTIEHEKASQRPDPASRAARKRTEEGTIGPVQSAGRNTLPRSRL